jgi:ABC-type uncharacterized transport system permease subunit
MSSTFVPFVDLADELDSIIEKFRRGSDNRTLLAPLSMLYRKFSRQKVRSLVSAILALVSLYLLIPKEQTQTFLLSTLVLGFIALVLVFFISSASTWSNFPALLESD